MSAYTEYDTYEVRVELEGWPLTAEIEVPVAYRDDEQGIYNWIMDSLMLEWDRIEG